MHRANSWAIVGVAALALAGCGQPAGTAPGAGTAGPAAGGPKVGQRAPEIEGEDIDGVRFKLSDYRGKVVMLDFWGHW